MQPTNSSSRWKKWFRPSHLIPLLTILGAGAAIVLSLFKLITLSIAEDVTIALLALLAVDALGERLGLLDRIETHVVDLSRKLESRPSADELLLLRDELPSFLSQIQKGDDIWVAGRSLAILLNNYSNQIQEATKSGKRFRFMIVDPDNLPLMNAIASSSYPYPSAVTVEQHGRQALAHLKLLVENTPEGTIMVRLADHIPTCVYFIIDGETSHGQMVIEMYGYRLSPGQRLHIRLTCSADSRTFASYLRQFNNMWLDAKPFPNDKVS
ncbi:MAG: hypothetical protein NWE82_01265 [Candidatus Bathyarchaeota archaeon]|nr:hypothetical protein [Candidatus Bathyarchaeota archaeon]